MLVVRAIREDDLEGLLALAQQTGGGMTTLKPDRKALSERIEIACASFARQIAPLQCDYLFVMEDLDRRRLAGVCAIKSAVGLDEPFYNYRLGTLAHYSRELRIMSRLDTLYLSNDLTGSAELCSLFLRADYRGGSNGRLLSKSRMLFMAQFPELFPAHLFAEMRGFQHADGSSPFWDSLGRHFFNMEFEEADALSSPGRKAFIAELMPRYPLYVTYLSPEAQAAIGRVHEATVPARRLLEEEGLHYETLVDIFDGGPVLQARVSELRAVRDSVLCAVAAAPAAPAMPADAGMAPLLVSTTRLQDFRVIVAQAALPAGAAGIALDDEQRRALGCGVQAQVRALALHPALTQRPPAAAASA